jgi:hypothetical protein
MIGRTSTLPESTLGVRRAASIAWSSVSHAIMSWPPSCSRVSAKVIAFAWAHVAPPDPGGPATRLS